MNNWYHLSYYFFWLFRSFGGSRRDAGRVTRRGRLPVVHHACAGPFFGWMVDYTSVCCENWRPSPLTDRYNGRFRNLATVFKWTYRLYVNRWACCGWGTWPWRWAALPPSPCPCSILMKCSWSTRPRSAFTCVSRKSIKLIVSHFLGFPISIDFVLVVHR